MGHRATFNLTNIWCWLYFSSNEFRWWACEIDVYVVFFRCRGGAGFLLWLCFSLYFSRGFYTSHTPSMSCYEFVSVFYWGHFINPCFCLCLCVLLPRNCRRQARCYGFKRWLWLVMDDYKVLFGIGNRIRSLSRRPRRSRAHNYPAPSWTATTVPRAVEEINTTISHLSLSLSLTNYPMVVNFFAIGEYNII